MGERTPLALLDSAAAARMAVTEAVTNILAADVAALGDIRLSANWMAACGEPGEDAALYAAVHAVGMELCPALGIAIPVGKDSLSMKTVWRDGDDGHVRGGAGVADRLGVCAGARCARHADPAAAHGPEGHAPDVVDLGAGGAGWAGRSSRRSMGSWATRRRTSTQPATAAWASPRHCGAARERGHVLAYHDISDGGLLAALAEMAFASHCGLDIAPAGGRGRFCAALFAEELGVVLQVRRQRAAVKSCVVRCAWPR